MFIIYLLLGVFIFMNQQVKTQLYDSRIYHILVNVKKLFKCQSSYIY